MTVDVMLDLETMGVSPTAAIIQIGACAFDIEVGVGDGFERTISLQSSLIYGGKLDQDTLDWWKKQPAEARKSVSIDADDIFSVLNDFTKWFPDNPLIWSNGASFDVPVLHSAYNRLGLEPPWPYNRVRDTRTLWDLATTLAGWTKPHREVSHTALANAIAQAEDVQSAYAALKGRGA